MNIYLDWNVFNKLEKRESLEANETELYKTIYCYIRSPNVFTPYSNAHLNDLARGYKKSSAFIEGHLNFLAEITSELCVCQYWDQKSAKWHFRNPNDFFYEMLLEKEDEAETFEDLVNDDLGIGRVALRLLSLVPIPKEFKKIYETDNIFNVIYPTTKQEMTQLAMANDLYQFSRLMSRDFSIYKAFRKFYLQSMQKLKSYNIDLKSLNHSGFTKPKYLCEDVLWEHAKREFKKQKNELYDNIIDTFFRHDLKGYKSDAKFDNMIDDALHTFYASHCDYFITNDERCLYKAKRTYERLSIKTETLTAAEFYSKINRKSND